MFTVKVDHKAGKFLSFIFENKITYVADTIPNTYF